MSTKPIITPAAKTLQDRLHELLTRLQATIELVKNWPATQGDDASIHVDTTTKLIDSIKAVIASTQKVDGVVKDDAELRKNLQSCLVPLDLLDLLDHGGGLNPDCFSRALLKESLGQLAGLKRRKLALEMLGMAVQSGLKKRDKEEAKKEAGSPENLKRKRQDDNNNNTTDSIAKPGTESIKTEPQEPPAKKQNTAS